MIFWRSWHVQNEVVHDKPPTPIDVSQQFLLSCMESLLQIKYHPGKDLTKGKFMLDAEVMKFHSLKEQTTEPCPHWTAPQAGWY
jgi:hypothetical protein